MELLLPFAFAFMVKAYIILAHKNPLQVERLIEKLDDDRSKFFIHIDKRISLNGFDRLLNKERIILLDRVASSWAGFGLVQAVLNGLYCIKSRGEKYDHIILLSGQDYPIKSNEYINNFLEKNKHKSFMEFFSLPALRWKPRGGMYRIDKYFFGLSREKKLSAKLINGLASCLPPLRRKLKKSLKPFGGSQWWIINNHTLNVILQFNAANTWYTIFHRYTFGADEVFFQMLLMNQEEELKHTIINDHKRFMNWPDPSKGHPEILTKNDLHQILDSSALFARKFDIAIDQEILDLIDLNCLSVGRS